MKVHTVWVHATTGYFCRRWALEEGLSLNVVFKSRNKQMLLYPAFMMNTLLLVSNFLFICVCLFFTRRLVSVTAQHTDVIMKEKVSFCAFVVYRNSNTEWLFCLRTNENMCKELHCITYRCNNYTLAKKRRCPGCQHFKSSKLWCCRSINSKRFDLFFAIAMQRKLLHSQILGRWSATGFHH